MKLPALLLLSAMAVSPAAAQECIDVELVLLSDLSGSMDKEEQKIVRDGHVAAFRDGAVLDQILRAENPCGAIYVTYVEFAATQKVVVDWTLIDSDEAAEDFAVALQRAPFSDVGAQTYISMAMDFAGRQIANNGVDGLSRVVDILADGQDKSPMAPASVVEKYSGKGIPLWEQVTFNGLPVISNPDFMTSEDIVTYFNEQIIGGPAARTIPARGFSDVPRAIVEKLSKELG